MNDKTPFSTNQNIAYICIISVRYNARRITDIRQTKLTYISLVKFNRTPKGISLSQNLFCFVAFCAHLILILNVIVILILILHLLHFQFSTENNIAVKSYLQINLQTSISAPDLEQSKPSMLYDNLFVCIYKTQF